MGVKFANNATGTLVAGINSSVTTLTLNSGEGVNFPTASAGQTDYFFATLVDVSGNREIIKVIQRTGDVFDEIERAADGSTAQSFVASDKVQLRFPKIILEAFRDDIATNATNIGTNDTDIAALQTYNSNSAVLAAPSGITMYIYNPAGEIPTGWSAKSGPADCLLAVVGGSNAYNVAGETLAGSWTPTGHVHTGGAHVHTMNTHVHTMNTHVHTGPSHSHTGPEHSHQWYNYISGANDQSYNSDGSANNLGNSATGYDGIRVTSNDDRLNEDVWTSKDGTGATGSSGTDNTGATDPGDTNATDPGDTNSSGTANTGSSKEPSTDRQYAACGLLIERD